MQFFSWQFLVTHRIKSLIQWGSLDHDMEESLETYFSHHLHICYSNFLDQIFKKPSNFIDMEDTGEFKTHERDE